MHERAALILWKQSYVSACFPWLYTYYNAVFGHLLSHKVSSSLDDVCSKELCIANSEKSPIVKQCFCPIDFLAVIIFNFFIHFSLHNKINETCFSYIAIHYKK